MNWSLRHLEDCASFSSGGTPNKQRPEYWDGDIPWVSSAELTDRFIDDTRLHITTDGLRAGSRLAPVGTIFAVVRGMSLATEFRISLSRRPMAFNQDVKAIMPKPGIDGTFLFYALSGRANEIRDLATEAAHGTKKLEMNRLSCFPISVPDLETQRKVATIGFAYDDLIAANQRRIQLLEESARLLYREWFLKLRFPGHETVMVNDGVPKGWRKAAFSSVAEFINGFAFKPAHLFNEGLPIVKIPELRDGVSDRTPCNPGFDIPVKYRVATGDLLFSWSATLLVNEWSEGLALLNQHLFKVVPKLVEQKRMIRFALENAIPQLLGQSVGATMQHIRRGALDDNFILMPDDQTSQRFAELVDPLMDQVLTVQVMNRGLIKARDLLLPKLMSGALDVSRINLLQEVAA